MPNNTITLKLEGDVSPEEFASAVSGFTQLLTALQRAVVPKSSIEWIVSDLHAGSASMTYAGSEDIPDAPNVEKLTREYFNAVTARANSEDINYPQPVVKALNAVIGVLNGRISAVRFESGHGEATVTSPDYHGPDISTLAESYGSVTGRIQTLTSRGGLKFTLYDLLNDRAVSCYLSSELHEKMRGLWGHVAIVEGVVTREVNTGRPISIRNIRRVDPSEDSVPGQFKEAEGAVKPESGSRSPEELIRLFRDG